jgi:hypothetical protein
MVEQTNVLIPWYPISYLMIASSGFFGGGAYAHKLSSSRQIIFM